MDDILNQLIGQIGSSGIHDISKQIGSSDEQAKNALGGIVPTLLGAMSKNTSDASGANGLLAALDKDHDGSILDDIPGFVNNYSEGPGSGILKHVLGSNEAPVTQGLSSKTGLESSQISSLMQIAAPLIMGLLGKQKRQNSSQGFDAASLTDMLGGMTRQADNSTGIDLGDILNIVGGLTKGKSSGGIGGILSKLFGR